MRRSGGDKIHNTKKELNKQDFKRQKENKDKIFDVIIACEDEVSARIYFELLVSKLREGKIITPDSFVIAKHKHSNPNGVLEDLKKHKCDNGKTYKNFEHKWIVIDRDVPGVNGGGHSKEDFNNAINNAQHLKVNVAYANDSFELWYLLHFTYRSTSLLRDDILKEVINRLKAKNSSKFSQLNDENIKQVNFTKLIFEELLELQETAIDNAIRLLASYSDSHNPESDNPSTTIHKLVEILNGLNNKGVRSVG